MPTKETIWKNNMSKIRDIAFIILFLGSTGGWIRSETRKNTKLEVQVEVLTDKVIELTKQAEKTNDILSEQQILNGKIIQYMEMR